MDMLLYLQIAGWLMAMLADAFTVILTIAVVTIAMNQLKKG
jgi:hypothetical protein